MTAAGWNRSQTLCKSGSNTCWRRSVSGCRECRQKILVTRLHIQRLSIRKLQSKKEYETEVISQEAPKDNETSEDAEEEEKRLGVRMALGALYFYRSTLSPLMPKSCRFLPTCSEYSMEAFKEFGFWKGGVLTAWRLARCNPFGGKGYDPPKWPPVGLEKLF